MLDSALEDHPLPEQALYLKWRPMTFNDVVGQEHITRALRNSLKTSRIRHAYLFSGPRGTGKTTMARLLAKAVNCQHEEVDRKPCNQCPACLAVNEGRYLDLIEIDAATHTGVDDVRDLRDKIAFAPGEGQYKVYIIDEVHRFTGNAFDALLKTLEEPPDHAIFVLATTEIDKVPPTIKSRCLQFEFRRLSLHEVADRLEMIAHAEGLQPEREALELIARHGTGSVRDSISLLDQIVTDPGEVISLALVQSVLGTAGIAAVKDVVEALIERNGAAGLRVINAAVDSGTDPRQFGQQIVEHLRCVLLAQTAGADLIEASQEERAVYEQQASQIDRPTLIRAIRAFNDAVNSYRGGWQPQLSLELALMECLHAPVTESAPQEGAAARPAQTPAAAAGEVPAPPDLPPGTPPVIEAAVINERWDQVLKALYRYSKTSPDVMMFFRVHRVDGNIVTLGTDNDVYFQRIQPHPEKRKTIEKALYDVFKIALKLKVELVKGTGDDSGVRGKGLDLNDPLLAEGAKLGADISRIERKNE